MAKLRRSLLNILLLVTLLALGAQPAVAASLPPQAQAAEPVAPIPQTIPETYQLVTENNQFQLYLNPDSLAFKVVDKRSGYIWHSNLDEVGDDDRLNRTWTAFASSGISIDYLDVQAIDERNSITNAETVIDIQLIDQGFSAEVTFVEPSISLTVIVKLEPAGVSVQIPFESIQEASPDFKLGEIYVYPFFGATRDDSVSGYMFVPDGSGSLINLDTPTKAKKMFYGRYYGTDLGMITLLPWDPFIKRAYNLSLPVSGMVHGVYENAFIAIVESGAAFGELQVHPAGIITNFNFMSNVFIYNQSYFQATNRSGAGVTTLQPATNNFDITVHYRFLTGTDSDYVGMARAYQNYLLERDMLQKIDQQPGDIGIKLEFLGGEKERVLIWQRLIPMTTVAQMAAILNDLEVHNPEVVYYGWQPLGASAMPPTTLKLDRGLGTTSQLRILIDEIEAEGGNFYLYYDPLAAFEDEPGYSLRNDVAMSITNFNLMAYNRNKVNYFLNYPTISSRYPSLSRAVFTDLQAGLALDTIGTMLFSDFKPVNRLNRQATITAYQELLAENPGPTAFYLPNDYLFGFMRAYFDMPLTNSGYTYTSETVPFIPIVLSGYVPYYGAALNFSSDTQEDLLRHVDFGVYPSYYLTQEITARILNTYSSWIYTSSIAQWGAEIEANYAWLNSLLGPVKGQPIVARTALADGVYATTYANGMQIVVNYNNRPFTADGISIDSRDAVIREVTP